VACGAGLFMGTVIMVTDVKGSAEQSVRAA
jgi:hypothetical protein